MPNFADQHQTSPSPLACLFILTCTTLLLLAAGCDRGPAGMLKGDYVNAEPGGPPAKLTITASTMKASFGPMTLSADYTVQKTDGQTVTVALSGEGIDKGETLAIQVTPDTLNISGNGPMGGKWKRK